MLHAEQNRKVKDHVAQHEKSAQAKNVCSKGQESKNPENLHVCAAGVKKTIKKARQGPKEPFIPRGEYMARIKAGVCGRGCELLARSRRAQHLANAEI